MIKCEKKKKKIQKFKGKEWFKKKSKRRERRNMMDEYLNEKYNLWILNTSEEEEEVERDDWVDDDEKGWRSQESVLKEKSARRKE